MTAMSFRRPAALAALGALALSPLVAQEAPPAGNPATPPAGQTPRTPPRGERPPAQRRSPEDSIGRITLVDEQPTQVVALLEKITGRIALRSDTLPATKINFTATRDLNRIEAETALESLLALNGIAVLPEGDAFLKVVPSTGRGAQPWAEAPQLYLDSVKDLPSSDRMVARLFTLKNVPYTTIDQAIQTVVNKTRGGSAVAMPVANTVLVTDSLSNVKQIEEIIARVDVPNKVLFFPLKNTRSDDVVKQLKSLQNSGMRFGFAGDIGFEATTVNNQIMVYTNPANAERVGELIKGIDTANVPLTETISLPLRHMEAPDAVTLITNIATGTSGTVGQKTTSSFNAQGAQSGNASTNRNNTAATTQNRQLNSNGQNGQNNARNSTGPENSTFSNYFTAVADQRSNSLVLYGTTADIAQAKKIVETIDVPLQQVRVEAIIVEVTLANNEASGLDKLGIGTFTGTQGVVNGRHNGDYNFNGSMPVLPGDGGGSAPLSVAGSIRDFSLEVLLNKVRNDTSLKVLSSPTLVTSHNAKAMVVVSTQYPLITGTTSTANGTLATQSSITPTDIGLELDIIPRIGSNGLIELDVQQSIKSIIGNTTIDGNNQPIVSNRSANSYLTAHDGETIVLAGLQQVNDKRTKGKMFLLGDIPWIGDWLFSPETTESTKTELIIFLKPHVITEKDRVPASDTPGLRDGSLTKEISENRIRDGVFTEAKTPTTVFEKEAAEKKAKEAEKARERAEEEAAKKAEGAK